MIPVHFAHANGFPAPVYRKFFEYLQPHPVSFVDILGAGNYTFRRDWRPAVPELIRSIEQHHTRPVIGLGHSFGGVLTLWAAIERPDLFHKIILFDPPIFSRFFRIGIGLMGRLGLNQKMVPIAKNALRRRSHFSSREEAFEYWKRKSLFREFHPDSLEAYVQYGLKPADAGGFELTIPAELESQIFATAPSRLGPVDFQMPSFYVYASKGILTPSSLREHKKLFRKTSFIEFDGNHMFPLEQPLETAEFVKSLIRDQ